MPDVTIIGAGPGGSTAAIALARAGWGVTVVEQSRFPRDKVCGECLSALGFDVLTRLGLATDFKDLGAVRLDRCEIHARSGRCLPVDLPQPMWGMSRHAFDGMLLDAALRAGATLRQPVRCESLNTDACDDAGSEVDSNLQAACEAQQSPGSIDRSPGTDPVLRSASHPACHIHLRLRDLVSNRVETISPTHLILADGKAAFATDPPAPTGDFGIKTHFENVNAPRDRIELFAVRGSYGGLAPIEADRWNVAFSVPARRLKAARGDLEALFAELMTENAALARRLVRAQRVGLWLASPLPRFGVRDHWHPNVTPVGNAAAALEPIGGEGMGLAMRSAEMAALELIRDSNGEETARWDGRRLVTAYRRLWDSRRLACRGAALAVSSRLCRPSLAMGRPKSVVRAALQLLGK